MSLRTRHIKKWNAEKKQRNGINGWEFLESNEISEFHDEIKDKIR